MQSLITIFLLTLIVPPSPIKASELLIAQSKSFIYAIYLSLIMGLIFSVLSFYKHENSRFVKYIGGLLNLILILFFIGSIVFAIIIDSSR